MCRLPVCLSVCLYVCLSAICLSTFCLTVLVCLFFASVLVLVLVFMCVRMRVLACIIWADINETWSKEPNPLYGRTEVCV